MSEWWVYGQGEIIERRGFFLDSTEEKPARWYGPFADRANAEQCAADAARGRAGVRVVERAKGWRP